MLRQRRGIPSEANLLSSPKLSYLNPESNVILVTSLIVTTYALLLLTFSLGRAMLPSAVSIRVLIA
jgi:hypothetical protein